MVNIGVIGLGFMGRMHLGAYRNIPRAKLVAISDQDPKRAAGDFSGGWGNMEGGVEKLDMSSIHGSTDWRELIALEAVQMVDICLPTPSHNDVASAALKAGKHVLCEKPLALDSAEARQIADAAGNAKGLFMPAMCLRFWPQWAWLKQANDQQTYGPMQGLRIIRIGGPPAGWFRDGAMSGGAILDLHIHDTDFICHLFGPPHAVFSRGYSQYSGKADHVVTQYLYDAPSVPPMIVAEGGWLGEGFGFSMQYVANFRDATVDYDSRRADPLLVTTGGKTEPVKLEGDGYTAELAYFIDCIEHGRSPRVVTAADAVTSIRVVEAEQRSIDSGAVVRLA